MKKIIIIIIFLSLLIQAQTNKDRSPFLHRGKNSQMIIKEPGHLYSLITTKEGEININDINLLEMIDVIVEFKDVPMFLKLHNNKLSKTNRYEYEMVFDQFYNDISDFTNILSKRTNSPHSKPIIKKEFYKLFNGINIEIPKGLLNSIYSLDYVKKVHRNERMEIINESVKGEKEISPVRNPFNIKGDNIVIGIIDTGIDYLHPALGGGFGLDYKVIGGYDIIDEDDDPMDEIGHGTHVAGIAAANGDSIKGIAPNAMLMAFKVFSNNKPTYQSTIIEAVELAIDPNNDGNYNDKVDVVNMSLGGMGNPDDPVSTSVNNAITLGTVFCIAVGNSYDYYTIMSPGNALLAIGVGAKDITDQVAFFSSKGPTRKTYSIKPDVIAPGVDIYSTFLNSSYENASGTSMATPYIAGLCALIKSAHQNWTPQQIKSAVMNTANLLNDDIMAQGSGVVNLDKALNSQTTISPSSLSFGYCDVNTSIWTILDTIVIKNESSLIKNYTVSNSTSNNFIGITPSRFSLNPNASAKIIIKLTVNNSITPYIHTNSFSYSGIINISSENESLHIPWAFVKAPKLVVRFDKPVSFFLLTGKNNTYFPDYPDWNSDFTSAELLIPNGTYDLFSLLADVVGDSIERTSKIEMIFTEKINFIDHDEIIINSAIAKNNISFKGVNENGDLLSGQQNWLGSTCISFPDSLTIGTFTFVVDSGTAVKFSNVSNRYTFFPGEFKQDLINENKVYVVNHKSFKGTSSDIQLSNSRIDFKRTRINVSPPPYKDSYNLTFGSAIRVGNEFYYGIGTLVNKIYQMESVNWNGTLLMTPEYDKFNGFSTSIIADGLSEDITDYSWFVSDIFRVKGDSIGCYNYFEPTPNTYFTHDNELMLFGNGMASLYASQFVSKNNEQNLFNFFVESFGPMGEKRWSDVFKASYSLYNGNETLIREGRYFDQQGEGIVLNPGNYRLELKNNNYVVGDAQGHVTLNSKFSVGTEYFYLPVLTSAQITNSNNVPVFILKTNEQALFKFSVLNYEPSSMNAQVYIKDENSEDWTMVTTKRIENDLYFDYFFSADISDFTGYDSTALDLKLLLTYPDNNFCEILWEPAVGVGKFRGSLEDTTLIIQQPLTFSLYNNYPNPFNSATTITYFLSVESKVSIEIFNILGEKIETVFEGINTEGEHKTIWNADRFSSGIYFYRLTAEGKSYFQKTNKMILLK